MSTQVEDLHKMVNKSMCVEITSWAASQQLGLLKLLSGHGSTPQLHQSCGELPPKEVVQSSPGYVLLLLLPLVQTPVPIQCCSATLVPGATQAENHSF